MTEEPVSIARLTEWLGRFETLLREQGDQSTLGAGMSAVREKIAGTFETVGELFTAVGMTLVGSTDGASGPLYGTFFLRFGMDAGAAHALDAVALGRALRAGREGVVARGSAAIGQPAMLEVLTRAIDGYDVEIASGGDAATASSTAFHSARDDGGELDADAVPAVLMLEALASALTSS